VAFITIKGALKIYHKQQQYVRQSQRKILDFTDSNIKSVGNRGTRVGPSSHDQ
jgi:E3 ubiquitin-protein ligase MARCH5